MEKIIRLKNLIEEALATYTGFNPVYSSQWEALAQFTKNKIYSREQMEEDIPERSPGTVLKLSEDIKKGAVEYLNDFQRDFIETRSRAENSFTFLKKELERIEGLFSLPTYFVEFGVRVRDGKTQKELRIENETFYYDFSAIEADLPQGRIKGESKDGVISHLLATINFYFWLKELAAQSSDEEPEKFRNKRLIWNGSQNALAYIFYQLQKEFRDGPTPVLDATNEDLAEFLRANFECFKNTKVTSIMAYFETTVKHPKTGKNKFTIVRGNPIPDED